MAPLFRIGYASAKRFAQEGAKVMICSRKEENVSKALYQLHKEGTAISPH